MTPTQEAVMRQALEALESLFNWQVDPERGQRCSDAITALRAALAEPVQEPVATMTVREDMGADFKFSRPHTLQPGQQFHLYTTPPQRKPLTEEEIRQIALDTPIGGTNFARATERAHVIGE